MSDRVLRRRVVKLNSSATDAVNEGYGAFPADYKATGSSDESCAARIYFRVGGRGSWYYFEGKTGTGKGHAEMAALFALCDSSDINWNVDAFKSLEIQVDCQDKPCCLHCSSVLGLLGIAPTDGTYKYNKPMGGTQWAIGPKLRAFVGECSGYDAKAFEGFHEVKSA